MNPGPEGANPPNGQLYPHQQQGGWGYNNYYPPPHGGPQQPIHPNGGGFQPGFNPYFGGYQNQYYPPFGQIPVPGPGPGTMQNGYFMNNGFQGYGGEPPNGDGGDNFYPNMNPFHQQYHAPADHPYSRGGGVGYQHPMQYGGFRPDGFMPVPQQPHPHMPMPSKGLNPAAQGFQYQPRKSEPVANGTISNGGAPSVSSATPEIIAPVPEKPGASGSLGLSLEPTAEPEPSTIDKVAEVVPEPALDTSKDVPPAASEVEETAEASKTPSEAPAPVAVVQADATEPVPATPGDKKEESVLEKPATHATEEKEETPKGLTFTGASLAGVTSPKAAPSRRPRRYTHDPIRIRPSRPSPDDQGNSYDQCLAKCIPQSVAVEHVDGVYRRRSCVSRSKPLGRALLAFGIQGGRPLPKTTIVFGEITSAPITPVVTPPVPSPAPPPAAGPAKVKPSSWASLLRAPTGGSASAKPRPAFNYAAAAAVGAPLSPAEDLARLLTEGLRARPVRPAQPIIPRGLVNTGNMCFANTIFQVLRYCPPFTDLPTLRAAPPLLEAMIIFLREFVPGPSANGSSGTSTPKGKSREDAFIPENLYDAMKENKRFDSMRRGYQEDAEEYLGFFLNTLHEELLGLYSRTKPPTSVSKVEQANGDAERTIGRPVSPGAAEDGDDWLEVGKKQKTHVVRAPEAHESAITRIFGGTLRSVLHAPGQKDSVTLEPYQPLQLDVQAAQVQTIVDALKHMNDRETVPGVWVAARNAHVDATKQVFFDALPPVLILHLKRFVYDPQEQNVVKRAKPVAYGTELVIPQEIISPPKRTTQPIKYRLFGVVYHHGHSATGGHYTVAVSRPDGTGWLHFDDEAVQPVPTEDVIVSDEEVRNGRAGLIGGRERCAYLLFYQRVR
ncbi:hypothetical protein CspeluHIS016_0901280 [Cutaneotrichosporon spelunceum]|uniref:ubiquitinyl hydrolase 1 n=1 Tax=Cutaneotrichosporon spelunceum TaxID=1672016 RepID=A0AAD3U0C1_9TREE|nr:hypothetical protein CspeluHIS016_0901280 [Cutaneotrichosporon spelunceum]